jgi:1-acyl-sn-glycerol-3-phosphate acyltransferase
MYSALRIIIRFFVRILFRVRAEGVENFPESGAAVVCANHSFMKDLLIISGYAPRKVRWLAKAELFRFPLFAWLIRYLGAFPLNRGEHDRGAVRSVYKILKDGEPLGIFPEGTRVADLKERPPIKRGFVTFAVNAGVPIIPVSVRYESGPFGRGRLFCGVALSFGTPVNIDGTKQITREKQDEIATEVMNSIYKKIIC